MMDKSTQTTIEGFDDIHTHIGSSPVSVYMDRGLEFNSRAFREYCAQWNIKPLFCHSSTKAAIVERAQRTFKGIMHKFMGSNNTNRYIDMLSDIVRTFNIRINRSVKMTPNEAYQQENKNRVLNNLEAYYTRSVRRKKTPPKFRPGDTVRILRQRNPYIKEKGYKPKFTDEIFQIHRVDKRLPIVRYTIQDRDGQKIEGSFLKHELSRVIQ